MTMLQMSPAYFVLCLVVGALGAKRKFGFWGYFFCSILMTPVLGFLLVLASDDRSKKAD